MGIWGYLGRIGLTGGFWQRVAAIAFQLNAVCTKSLTVPVGFYRRLCSHLSIRITVASTEIWQSVHVLFLQVGELRRNVARQTDLPLDRLKLFLKKKVLTVETEKLLLCDHGKLIIPHAASCWFLCKFYPLAFALTFVLCTWGSLSSSVPFVPLLQFVMALPSANLCWGWVDLTSKY